MADFELEVVRLFRRRETGAETVRSGRLTDRADIIALALDRHQRGACDGSGLDRHAADPQPALRQVVLVEHAPDRVEVEIRRQIHDGAVLVVKGSGRRRTVAVAPHQVAEHRPMCRDVAVEIHAQKTGELQETWIDPPERPGITHRHRGDDRALEPVQRMRRGETVDRGRVDPGVDRAAHQHHRGRLARVARRRQQCRRRQHRNRWLAYR